MTWVFYEVYPLAPAGTISTQFEDQIAALQPFLFLTALNFNNICFFFKRGFCWKACFSWPWRRMQIHHLILNVHEVKWYSRCWWKCCLGRQCVVTIWLCMYKPWEAWAWRIYLEGTAHVQAIGCQGYRLLVGTSLERQVYDENRTRWGL